MGKTPLRNVRVSDEVWDPARAVAEARGENLSEVIRAALIRYARRHRDLIEPPPN